MSDNRPFLKKSYSDITENMMDILISESKKGSSLTDLSEGSVVRTLIEVFSRELAGAYEQLELVFKMGYINTAEGIALDKVVALLGIERKKGGYLEGKVTFSRTTPAPDDIPIPAGTQITGSPIKEKNVTQNIPLFETIVESKIEKGQVKAIVNVISIEKITDPTKKNVPKGSLNQLPRPIWGIEKVVNETDMFSREKEETDEELRARAKRSVFFRNLGTYDAIKEAVTSLGYPNVHVQEMLPENPGILNVTVDDDKLDENELDKIKMAVEEARPAGILVNVESSVRIYIQIEANLKLAEELSSQQEDDLKKSLQKNISDYIADLKLGQNVKWSKIQTILTEHEAILEIKEKILTTFIKNANGELVTIENKILANNDIFIGSNENAIEKENGINLIFEPLSFKIFLDINIETNAIIDEASLKESIKTNLKNFFTGKISIHYLDIYDRIIPLLPENEKNKANILFIFMHERDGRVIQLIDSNDSVSIEKCTVEIRNILFTTKEL